MVDVLLFLRIFFFLCLSLSLSLGLFFCSFYPLLRAISCSGRSHMNTRLWCADWSVSVRVVFFSLLFFHFCRYTEYMSYVYVFFFSWSCFFCLSLFLFPHIFIYSVSFFCLRCTRLRYVTQVHRPMCTKIKYLEHDCTCIRLWLSNTSHSSGKICTIFHNVDVCNMKCN